MKVTLLSAQTLRSYAYATTLERHENWDVSIVEYGKGPQAGRVYPEVADSKWEPLPHWLRVDWRVRYEALRQQSRVSRVDADLNSDDVVEALAVHEPDLIVFAGAAGNLVGPKILEMCPVLHLHPGRLPDFRGSTTIYWSLLANKPVAVSAIFLNAEIDRGGLLRSDDVPPPARDSDIDGIYDAGIRAVVLDRLLAEGATGLVPCEQRPGGVDYYVIHPVLKNIVLGRLASQV